MSKEIRELEENSKRIIENMRPQTIAQYHIKQWLDDNFIQFFAENLVRHSRAGMNAA